MNAKNRPMPKHGRLHHWLGADLGAQVQSARQRRHLVVPESNRLYRGADQGGRPRGRDCRRRNRSSRWGIPSWSRPTASISRHLLRTKSTIGSLGEGTFGSVASGLVGLTLGTRDVKSRPKRHDRAHASTARSPAPLDPSAGMIHHVYGSVQVASADGHGGAKRGARPPTSIRPPHRAVLVHGSRCRWASLSAFDSLTASPWSTSHPTWTPPRPLARRQGRPVYLCASGLVGSATWVIRRRP